jgi:outer membrane lipoprotein-sorting protein
MSMLRLRTLAFLAAPLAVATAAPSVVVAQSAAPLSQVQSHLKTVNTMTANFTQTDRRGQTLNGTLTMKRPGKVRFEYGKGTPMLIVSDGRRLNMIDYQVRQVESWPIGNSPLSVLLNPNQNLSGIARVTENNNQVLLVEARDPKKPEFGRITLAFAKVPSAPAGLMLTGWTTVDAQNNRTTIKLSNQRFNVSVADSAFNWTDPRRGRGPRG